MDNPTDPTQGGMGGGMPTDPSQGNQTPQPPFTDTGTGQAVPEAPVVETPVPETPVETPQPVAQPEQPEVGGDQGGPASQGGQSPTGSAPVV